MPTFLHNKKAIFNYVVEDTIEAGIRLKGFEVKALKTKSGGSLEGAYVVIKDKKVLLRKSYIAPYQLKNTPDWYNPYRDRPLLISKKQAIKLEEKINASRMTLIPLEIYSKGALVKVKLALAKGKNKSDKRQTIKEREDKRAINRALKNSTK